MELNNSACNPEEFWKSNHITSIKSNKQRTTQNYILAPYLNCWDQFWAPQYKKHMYHYTGLGLSRVLEDDGAPGRAERAGTAQPDKDSGGPYI